ncbi:biotin--[acetyl-CoA-carboxylase] ligase [Candidatus Woesearchaeota archaeon]|nr:biotin--[acetyl-CoA-carboxylase] ligase [Candidatus Woesearchaeota archaeon]
MMFHIHTFPEVDSTNEVAKKYPANNVIVAEEQIRGRGRFGRKWVSSKGGLWFSLVLEPGKRLFEYTFIGALAVLESIGTGETKWPNDILVEGKKICGILSEVEFSGNEAEKVVVGIGLNVNNELSDITKIAVSLKEVTGKESDLNELLGKILKRYEELLTLDHSDILRMFKEKCGMLGKNVTVKSLDKTISGEAVDINDEGHLVVQTEEGPLVVQEGDVTLL